MLLESVRQAAHHKIFCARKIIVRSQSHCALEEGLLYRKTGLLFEYPTASGNIFIIKISVSDSTCTLGKNYYPFYRLHY